MARVCGDSREGRSTTRLLGRACLLIVLAAPVARAHGVDAGKLLVEVDGALVRVTETPGIGALGAFDTDRNGLLSAAEVKVSRERIRAQVDGGFSLRDGHGAVATCDASSVSTPGLLHDATGHGAAFVRIGRTCRFAAPPDGLVVQESLASLQPLVVEALRVERAAGGAWVPAGGVVRTVLSRESTRAELFAPTERHLPPWTDLLLLALFPLCFACLSFVLGERTQRRPTLASFQE